jgi:chromatin structure-remodeling complex subunit RSC1/2
VVYCQNKELGKLYPRRAYQSLSIMKQADEQELRQTDFMNIVPWDRIVDPPMDKSPFLRGIRGPGFFAEPREGGEEEEEEEGPPRRRQTTDTGNKRLSTAAAASASVAGTPTTRPYVPTAQANRYPPSGPYPGSVTTPNSTYRPSLPHAGSSQRPNGTPQPALSSTHGRTIAAMMGGPQVVDQVAVREYLPIEVGTSPPPDSDHCTNERTARLFERDARNQVLWFSGPPLIPGQVKIPAQPTHSLEYLEYLTKRKNGPIPEIEEEGDGPRGKRFRVERESIERTEEDEDLGQESKDEDGLWWAQGMSDEQIARALLAVIESA